MKKSEIDRWMRHQSHVSRQVSISAVNWVLITTVLIVTGVLALMILRLTQVL